MYISNNQWIHWWGKNINIHTIDSVVQHHSTAFDYKEVFIHLLFLLLLLPLLLLLVGRLCSGRALQPRETTLARHRITTSDRLEFTLCCLWQRNKFCRFLSLHRVGCMLELARRSTRYTFISLRFHFYFVLKNKRPPTLVLEAVMVAGDSGISQVLRSVILVSGSKIVK
jgi:hypothetical protein